MVKYCSKCGAPNSDDAAFCVSCGNKFETVQNAFSNQQSSSGTIPPGGTYGGGSAMGNQQMGNSNQQYYQGTQGFNIDNMFSNDFQTSKTLILIAMIFSIIAIVAFAISGFSDVISALTLSALYASNGVPAPITVSFLYVYSAVYVIMFLASIIVFLRVKKIYDSLKMGNLQQALMLNSIAWGVIALIFSGIITGILMLISRGYMETAARMQH